MMQRIIHQQVEHGLNPSLQPLHAMSFPFPWRFLRLLSEKSAVSAERQARSFELPTYVPAKLPVHRLRIGYVTLSDTGAP